MKTRLERWKVRTTSVYQISPTINPTTMKISDIVSLAEDHPKVYRFLVNNCKHFAEKVMAVEGIQCSPRQKFVGSIEDALKDNFK